jgi:hypothetical protein
MMASAHSWHLSNWALVKTVLGRKDTVAEDAVCEAKARGRKRSVRFFSAPAGIGRSAAM